MKNQSKERVDPREPPFLGPVASMGGGPMKPHQKQLKKSKLNAESLWREHAQALRRFLRKRLPDASTADDLLQEIFSKIHTNIHTVRDHRRIVGWMYRMTRRAVIDHYRQGSNRALHPENLPPLSLNDREDSESLRELARCVRPFIHRLPKPYQEALILSELQGLTQQEVSRRQGVSLSGAKSRVQRGRKMLKAMILKCCRVTVDARGGIVDFEPKSGGGRAC